MQNVEEMGTEFLVLWQCSARRYGSERDGFGFSERKQGSTLFNPLGVQFR